MQNQPHNPGLPARDGLYDPANERDACGVGFVVNMHGKKSHEIVRSGLEILVNLAHRGACGCDPLTGDGAGILTQIPHEFFQAKAQELGFELPAPGDYAVGNMFLPPNFAAGEFCRQEMERLLNRKIFLELFVKVEPGWRENPQMVAAVDWRGEI